MGRAEGLRVAVLGVGLEECGAREGLEDGRDEGKLVEGDEDGWALGCPDG